MDSWKRDALIGIAASVVLGAVVGFAGSQGSNTVGDSLAVFAVCAILSFVINWAAYVPSYLNRTEKFYDITGTITYLSVTIVALALSTDLDARAIIAAAMVAVWAIRLGTYLFTRIRKDGKDGRFDKIKTDPLRLLMTWSLQALWVLFTAACALAIITAEDRKSLGIVGIIGIVVWVIGFAIEVVSDQQKKAFREDPANDGRFITTGLWAWSRHPNYFGEITLWTGMAIMALPLLSGWRWIMLISPIFVTVLLTRISGVPMLEARAKKRWGDEKEFQDYTANTPVLVLRPPR